MGVFKEMDQADVRAAIAGHKDVLAGEAGELESLYKQFRCPRCKCDLQKEFDPRHTFSDPSTMNPRALLRCPNCKYLIDPHSNIVLESGDASKIPVEPIPIIDPRD
jgi:hypothetical protein